MSAVVAIGPVPVAQGESDGREPGALEIAAQTELESFGRGGTLAGGLVLALARRLDQAGPADTGSGFAALAKELRTSLTAALAGAEQEDDPVDQLRRQREQKQRRGHRGG
ncbi:hypothetical protein AB5J52_14025 [Streptomyces sp. R39]|uniref:Uncharacterized protein n=1 Tax=Streptomyces sp. R39 TaxID=3238631 RepID=A0AB39QPR7_9ACTN